MTNTKFWTFTQNNTGGSFDFNEENGITHYVIIEARNADHANRRAEAIGLYFDGVDAGEDCECCGDRWSRQYFECDADAVPMVYSERVREKGGISGISWVSETKEVCVHPLMK